MTCLALFRGTGLTKLLFHGVPCCCFNLLLQRVLSIMLLLIMLLLMMLLFLGLLFLRFCAQVLRKPTRVL